MKNIQKTNEICYCLGGGKFPPLKALKKTLHVMFNCGILFVKIVFRCGILRFIPQVLIVE